VITAVVSVSAAVLTTAVPARADDKPARPTARHLELHAAVDLGLAGVYFASETFLKPSLAPETCRWCEPPPFDAAVRDAVVWAHPNRANLVSNFTGFVVPGAIGLGALYLESRDRDDSLAFLDDSIAVIDTAVAIGVLNQASKFTFGRARPFVHFGPPDRLHDPDDNLSFFSGHTAISFGVTFAAARAAQRRGYRSAPWILGAGLLVSTTTGYLRMAADKHYLSDVLVGAAVGGAIGWYLPGWLHRHELSIAPAPNGVAVTGVF
jgi:membrane-associated phospholipid phosphatase